MNYRDGQQAHDILKRLNDIRQADPPTHGGRILSYVYDPGIEGLDNLIAQATTALLPVNGLDPTTFSSVAVLEREVVNFSKAITHAPSDAVGSITSGGTESCLLAVKSARDAWRKKYPHASGSPLVVAPSTVHPAFHKACEYFDLSLHLIEIDPASGTVSPERFLTEVDALLDQGLPPVLAILSAPNYPLGVIDEIDALAPALKQRGVWVHVDACVGGFILPFWPAPLPQWDFLVEGVCSISMDLHKYGYAPKGASVLLYRDRDSYHEQFFACVSWPGYPVINPTVLGSRSATALASAWAVINYLGISGYESAVARIHHASSRLIDILDSVEGITILGNPVGPLLALTADSSAPEPVDPFRLVDELKEHHFLAQAKPGRGQTPRSAHLTLTPVTADLVEELGQAIKMAARSIAPLGPAQPRIELLQEVARDGLPQDQAEVMATLESLPPEVARPALIQLLGSVLNP